ncbi:helix-turn-helix domain-containing protein [Haladaptatus pallidirubidus]|uniref:Helix-turn-helix type 11 domain-containing protein n=1 Tax=Haladaptatus pallidirubidus TaxID=1008152 RepID=A0AAV3UHS4_9EURY|nr:helix-turn-helix domain-containing protein [Haladaptatus pallidirubidus]
MMDFEYHGMPTGNDEALEQILDLFATTDDPVLTANEIADQIRVSRRTVLRKLKQLKEEGKIERKEVGGRAVVWWRTL